MKLLKDNTTMCRLTLLTMSVMALLLLAIVELSSAEDDLTAPQLLSLSIAPTAVDVSSQSQTITFTARITDNLAGFNWGLITITSPSGSQSSAANAAYLSGTSLDGVWTFPITIQKSSETGTWKVTQILLQDAAGNSASFTEAQGIQVTGAADITPPQLQSLSFAPTTVDVSSQSQTITFTARITDNLAGFNWGVITITSPSGSQSSAANAAYLSGTSLDGVWTFPITIQKSSEAGTWKVTQILLQDSAGNSASFTDARGIQVTGAADITPPQLQSLSFAPTAVDVTTQSQTITFTARITDNLAGFSSGIITITSPSGSQSSAANAAYLSGTSLDGVWTFPITIQKSAETGTWKVTQILLQDAAGNNASFTEAQGIQVTGAADITPPQLLSLSFTPTTVDVTTQSQTITFTAHITDNLAGFNWGVITITSPSGSQSSAANAAYLSGTSLDGVWTFPITIQKSSETGTWKVAQIILQDSIGNSASFTEAQGIQVTGAADITPPQLQSLSIAPTAVDVITQSQTITFTAHITDNLAGFNWGVITIASPSGNQSSAANAVYSSGTFLDGIWTFPITIQMSSETGTWKVTQILLQDSAGNNASFTEAQGIQVTGTDTLPPTLTISTLANGTITNKAALNISGTVTDRSDIKSLIINNITVPVISNAFSTTITLQPGANTIITVATDTIGNQSSDTRTITLVPLPGDVNFSGIVDITDAILTLQALSGMTPAETVHKEADINGDSQIGMAEVIYILQKAAGTR